MKEFNSYTCGEYPIVSKKNPAAGIYDIEILCPETASHAVCGQFVNIRIDGFSLRRPISICGIDREAGTLRIVFEVRGHGTEKLAEKNKGDMIDILAPLGGKGFDLSDSTKKAVIIGGGIGNPPMLPAAQFYKQNAIVISGFRNASAVILKEDFMNTGAEYILCTDDGTAGRHGFVTEALSEVLEKEKVDIIYACGPRPMLKKICGEALRRGIRCQVSLEERMGCGVGACLVCACRTIREGREFYSHVCKDGPVFEAEEVQF